MRGFQGCMRVGRGRGQTGRTGLWQDEFAVWGTSDRRLTEHQLGYFHDGAPDDNAEAQALGERVLETVYIAEVEVPDERGVAFLKHLFAQDEGGL